jgi:signal transduction histidine kinase
VRGLPINKRLGWLFALAVILPSGLLAALAVRAIRREEAFIEKQLAVGLGGEVLQLSSSVGEELRRVQEELARGAPAAPQEQGSWASWSRDSALVGVPFLLSSSYQLAWPRPGGGGVEGEFLRRHGGFLAGREQSPVYTNIALAFKDEILPPGGASPGGAPAKSAPEVAAGPPGAEAGTRGAASAAGRLRAAEPSAPPRGDAVVPAPAGAAAAEAERAAAESGGGVEQGAVPEAPAADSLIQAAQQPKAVQQAEAAKQAAAAQRAVSAFESDREVRRKAYAEAESKGQPPAPRTVSPSVTLGGEAGGRPEGGFAPPPSVFVSEQLQFRQIAAGRESGLIPRLLEERLWLLFWKRLPDGRIVGCQLDNEELRARLLALLPPAATAVRVLTLLDERGEPLFAPAEDAPRDYRRPFVAREVSELLPRWEAAAYLSDPSLVASRARQAGLILWTLVALLTVSIAGGGTLVLRALAAEVRLARQKSSFVANVSHELKTPLTSIRMYAEMLQEGRQRNPARRRQYLGTIVEESRRLTRLVNRVLDFARLEQGRRQYAFEALDPEDLCRGVLENERPRLEQGGFEVAFRTRGRRRGAAKLEVRGDPEALAQVLLNLIGNAEKYSSDRKEITVAVGRESGRTRIRVLDRGPGIPSGAARHLFKEFYRGDDSLTNPVQGTGLGLAIARRIVRDHGGELVYLPRPGGGSIFQVELP